MKKFKISPLHIAFVLLILCGITTGVYSYMFKQTNEISNEFVPANVNCYVHEEVDNSSVITEKRSITIENTGNIDAYIRVRLVTYWIDSSNNIVAKASVMPEIQHNTDYWVIGSNNTYYYKTKVSPDAFTKNLLLKDTVIQLADVDENGCRQVVEIFAEAIQAEPANVVTESWKVELDGTTILKEKEG